VAGRKVLLLDGFSAHHSGLDFFNKAGFWPPVINIRVEFLPPNASYRSLSQPLDQIQGIIGAWKAHYYRRRWLQFVVYCFD